MFRFLLTGAFAFALCAANFAVGSAAETAATPAVVTYEAAAPTAGADLSMWNVAAGPSTEVAPAEPRGDSAEGSPAVRRFAGGIISRSTSIAVNLTRNAMRFLGVPYVFGGTRSSGFDCSGYVQHVFALIGLHLPRTADAQYYAGHPIAGAMRPGDLVFFQTYEAGPSHVGIYVGNSNFVHASSSHGVTVSSLHDGYWSARYLGAKRYSI